VSTCHLCAFDGLSVLPSYEALHRVTSDCKPWPPGGQLGVCPRCGGAQAIISRQWEEESRKIYDRYAIYHQSGGAEQNVFDAVTGAASSRSSRLLHRLKEELPFPSHGRLLDVGCGNGNTLRAFGETAAGWSLAGLDVTDHYKTAVESIPGVEALYTGEAGAVPGQFDVITLIHSLEHIPGPAKFLAGLSDKLKVGGRLVIQVPDCWQNPFMFLVADHATHFFEPTLRETVTAGGFDVGITANDWIAKELTLIARRSDCEPPSRLKANPADNIAAVRSRLEWVGALGQLTRALAAKNPLGVFGTSIAATWLQGELHGEATFFVDEDPGRFGQTFMGRQILRPSEVLPGSQVMIALPTPMAEQVRARLAREAPVVNWLVPPPLPR
jgi:2-polyprenyl-3-methyl-5-hydroxy-6-metoxy-1,4-benzoquinol methylase